VFHFGEVAEAMSHKTKKQITKFMLYILCVDSGNYLKTFGDVILVRVKVLELDSKP